MLWSRCFGVFERFNIGACMWEGRVRLICVTASVG